MIVSVNGHAINVEVRGQFGEPIVLLHSLGTHGGLWADQVDDLAKHQRVITIDLRGHGRSETSREPLTVDILADDVIGVVDHLGLTSFVLAGISLGGMVAQAAAARLGERVSRLVLFDTSLAPLSRPMWVGRAQTVRSDGLAGLARDIATRWHLPTEHPSPSVAKALDMLLATSDEGYAAGCDALATADCHPAAAAILCPTRVVVGDADLATPPRLAQDLAEAIKGARLTVIEGAAHLPMLDRSARVTAILRGED